MIFYEAPHKLPATLKDMAEYFGDRKIALVKELTKIHENVEHTTLFSARDKYNEVAPKGEFVVIVEGKPEEEREEMQEAFEDEIEAVYRYLEENKIANKINFNISSENNADLSIPTLYNNCANPIVLSYINSNIKTTFIYS